MRRKINRENPKNIKCRHCKFYDEGFTLNCRKRFIRKSYWNRCAWFEWGMPDD